MRQWLPLRPVFLDHILAREAAPLEVHCNKCTKRHFKIRCRDCIGNPVLCVRCCRDVHQDHPFHRIEIWSGTYFAPGWMWQTGVTINLGHGGARCPNNQAMDEEDNSVLDTSFPTCDPDDSTRDLDSDSEDDETAGEYGWASGNPQRHFPGAKIVLVVHINGVHHLPITPCRCPTSSDLIAQYLQMGFYPATYKQIETVFTFQVLDDYHLENLECQTSYHHYYSKLRRMTNKIFPNTVPVRRSGSFNMKLLIINYRIEKENLQGLRGNGEI